MSIYEVQDNQKEEIFSNEKKHDYILIKRKKYTEIITIRLYNGLTYKLTDPSRDVSSFFRNLIKHVNMFEGEKVLSEKDLKKFEDAVDWCWNFGSVAYFPELNHFVLLHDKVAT